MNIRSRRTIGMYFKVSPEEKQIISEKMKSIGITNKRAYLRKMALDGFIVVVDMEVIKQLVRLLRYISNNINQIAIRVNETHSIYDTDVQDLKQGYAEVWKQMYVIMKKFEKL